MKPFLSPAGVSDFSNYFDAPEDWVIFLTDVRGSTEAIQKGRYKDVNLIGVSGISAVKNACGTLEIPYVFGGDGATFVVPPECVAAVRLALVGTRNMAKVEFSMDLRVAQVTLSELAKQGQKLKIGRFQLSESVSIAVFAGGALEAAEKIAKDPGQSTAYEVSEAQVPQPDFSGLECRWQPIPSQRGEILSVLIKAKGQNQEELQTRYQEIIEDLELILGKTRRELMPLSERAMHVEIGPHRLRSEQKVRSFGLPQADRLSYFFKLIVDAFFGSIFIYFKWKVFGVEWGQYKQEVAQNSDFWKYDEMLRFVVDVSTAQKRGLMAILEQRRQRGEIYFGVHSSASALMTCLVSNRKQDHLHFIDGGDGGYAMAAQQLKLQLADGGVAKRKNQADDPTRD